MHVQYINLMLIDLQQNLQGDELMIFLLNEEVVDAPLSKLVKNHNPKNGSSESQHQQQPVRSSSTAISMAAMSTLHRHLSLYLSSSLLLLLPLSLSLYIHTQKHSSSSTACVLGVIRNTLSNCHPPPHPPRFCLHS